MPNRRVAPSRNGSETNELVLMQSPAPGGTPFTNVSESRLSTPMPFENRTVQFIGAADNKSAKYIKVSHNEDVSRVYEFIKKEWELQPPRLIVSVTGGAKNFKMKQRLTNVFKKSLINIAEGTGAWIITGGTNAGVMKHVGKAVQEHAAAKSNKKKTNKVVTLGIVTWGILQNKSSITEKGKHDINLENGSRLSVLDKNHTHFVLVDDGTVEEYGKEIKFRAQLEKHIAASQQDGMNVLICCVLVQGGPGSLRTVYEALSEGTPVVVVGGSGQWANILATLCTNPDLSVTTTVIQDLLRENSMEWKDEELSEWTNIVSECLRLKNLITIFQLDTPDSVQELDIAILESLLQADSLQNQNTDDNYEHQLKLALAWNRSDMADSHILTDDCKISQESLTEIFVTAVKQDKPEFVRVLIDHGVNLQNNFKWGHLLDLYRSVSGTFYGKNMLRKYCPKNDLKQFEIKNLTMLMKKLLGSSYKAQEPRDKPVDPLREVFQWAILLNKRDMARVIWRAMYEQLPAAFAATAMLKGIAQMSVAKSLRSDLKQHAEEYITTTKEVLTQCMKEDEKKTNDLLIRKLEKWGDLTCLQLAVDSTSSDVVAHPALQNLLNRIWKGGMKLIGWKGMLHLLSAFFFICPIFNIEFSRTNPDGSGHRRDQYNSIESGSNQASTQQEHQEPGFFKKFLIFHQAPITKYVVNIMFHLLFLTLFTYILLFNLFPYTGTVTTLVAPSVAEWCLLVWVFILSFDEVNEMLRRKDKTLLQQVGFWFSNHWNKMDLLGLLLFYLGFGLRFNADINGARVVLCLSFIVYCIRLLHVFTLSQTIGPKVVMVGNMLLDLWFFIFIVAIFVLAYGVTSQGLLYPNETRAWTAITGIFYKPYWQIYGELFLDEINYDPTSSAFECTNDQNLIDSGSQRCPQQQDVVPIISAFYMLLANILLLNLLIAMFSYTFTKLEENTDSIWKYQRYELIQEYYGRPALPAPLSIFWYICSIWSDPQRDNAFYRSFDENETNNLRQFEHWTTDSYLAEKRAEESRNVPTRIQGISDRLDNVVSSVASFSEHLTRQKKINKRVKQLEAHLSRTNESLEWIMQALQDNNTTPTNLHLDVHAKSRSSPYPDTEGKINRFSVPDHMVSWTVPMATYKPVFYTAPSVKGRPAWADPSIEGTRVEKRLRFNEYDDNYKVDRSSYIRTYSVIGGMPRNPKGRTGLRGRGLLGRYGPNHAADPIVTRWEKADDGTDLTIDGKKVLEFIAIKREDTGEWAIPGGMVDPGEKVTATLLREFQEEVVCGNPNMNEEDQNELKRKIANFFKTSGSEIFRGYCDDHRNTDNSWIETVAINFHDDSGEVIGNLSVSPGYEAKGAKWKRIEASFKLFASHQNYIKTVAEKRNAYF
uniref:Transient receptor potential cation channel subfamily M member 2-like n=1 Tax=Phallusia mammillata TaxID=59560 RepID=A0A6F9DV14_9ASCI|nr:transient receptor potential cation channel subfamily M member 2-like [Phallusia mammillata]